MSRKDSRPEETRNDAVKSSLALRIFRSTGFVNPGLPEIMTAPSTFIKHARIRYETEETSMVLIVFITIMYTIYIIVPGIVGSSFYSYMVQSCILIDTLEFSMKQVKNKTKSSLSRVYHGIAP